MKVRIVVAVVAAVLVVSCSAPEDGVDTGPTSTGATASPGGPSPTAGRTRTNALVTRVVDGDTVEVRFRGRALTVRLIGIDTAADAGMTRAAVTKIARATADLVRLGREVRDDDIVIDPRFCGPDYGLPDEATIAAIRMAARLEGMLTDPVYEGKSMAGLIAMARSGEIPSGAKVLYVHLGGAPALNAYHKAFE